MNLSEEVKNHLAALLESGIPLIVEGNKDKKTLRDLGLRNILTIHLPLYRIIEQLHCREVAILTDLDWRGKKLYRRIRSDCIRHGIHVNDDLRLFLLQETPLCHLEGLGTFLNHVEEKERVPRTCTL